MKKIVIFIGGLTIILAIIFSRTTICTLSYIDFCWETLYAYTTEEFLKANDRTEVELSLYEQMKLSHLLHNNIQYRYRSHYSMTTEDMDIRAMVVFQVPFHNSDTIFTSQFELYDGHRVYKFSKDCKEFFGEHCAIGFEGY